MVYLSFNVSYHQTQLCCELMTAGTKPHRRVYLVSRQPFNPHTFSDGECITIETNILKSHIHLWINVM